MRNLSLLVAQSESEWLRSLSLCWTTMRTEHLRPHRMMLERRSRAFDMALGDRLAWSKQAHRMISPLQQHGRDNQRSETWHEFTR